MAIMKMTPQELEAIRSDVDPKTGKRRVSDETIAKAYAAKNESFSSKWADPIDGIADPEGNQLNWNTAALNMEVYGNPFGPQQKTPEKSGGILGAIGGGLKTAFDYASAPIEAASQGVELGLHKGAEALGFKERPGAKKKVKEGLRKNLQQTADIAPATLGTIGTAAGPMGAAAGGFAGKAIENLIETGLEATSPEGLSKEIPLGAPYDLPIKASKLITEPLIEGALQGTIDKGLGLAGQGGRAAIKAGAAKLRGGMIKAGAILTNVGEDVLERAYRQPKLMTQAIESISKNSGNPFKDLAERVGGALIKKIDDSKKMMDEAKTAFIAQNPKAKIDVSANWDELRNVLKNENITLALDSTKSATKKSSFVINGVPGQAAIRAGQAKPYDQATIKAIEEYSNIILGAKNYGPADVLDLNKTYRRIYQSLDDSAGATQGQRILQKMKATVDAKIKESMPDAMKEAYEAFSAAAKMEDAYGSKFISRTAGKGGATVNDAAEGFIATLDRKTKGLVRSEVDELGEYLGIDITGEAELLKDAMKLSKAFPETGSRTLDIIRGVLQQGALAGGIVGGAQLIGGPGGALAGGAAGLGAVAATSPRVVGKAVIKAGATKMAASNVAQSRTFKGITGLMKKLAPAEKFALFQMLSNEIGEDSPQQ